MVDIRVSAKKELPIAPINVLHMSVLRGVPTGWGGGDHQIKLLARSLEGSVRTVLASVKGSALCQILREEFPFVEIPSSNLLDPRNMCILLRAVEKYEIHIISAHTSIAHSLGLWIRKFRPDISLVVHRHVNVELKKRLWTQRKYLNDHVDQFTAVSHQVGEKLYSYGVPPHKVEVIHGAAPLWSVTMEEKKEFKKRLAGENGADPSALFIGCAASFMLHKGQDILIDSLSRIKGKDFHCFFAGAGEQLESMKVLAQQLGLAGKVTFLGHVREMRHFFAAMDIVVLPSRQEAFGIVLLEGIYCRCLVVASHVGGVPEVIEDQKTGYLVPPEDPLKLSETLSHVMGQIRDREFLNSFLNQAEAITKSRFSVEKMAKSYLKVYRELMSKGL